MVADKEATYLNLKFLNGKIKISMVPEIHVRVLFREGRQHYTQVLVTPQRQARASWDGGSHCFLPKFLIGKSLVQQHHLLEPLPAFKL